MTTAFSHLPDGRAAILRHVESLSHLNEDERELLSLALSDTVGRHAGDEFIAAEASLDEPHFILSGWACRAASLPDGRRQILDFYIPGDLAGYCSRSGARAKVPYLCLTNAVTANAGALVRRVREQVDRYPGLTKAFLGMEDEIEKRMLDQIVRIGRMQAHERMADLISELQFRHHRAGTGLGNGFVMPLTQETLGDALGLSTVHVNRVLQQLRREQAIRTGAGRIEIATADFPAAHGGAAH